MSYVVGMSEGFQLKRPSLSSALDYFNAELAELAEGRVKIVKARKARP